MTQNQRLDYLIEAFLKDSGQYRDLQIPRDTSGKRCVLRSLMNVRMPKRMDDAVLSYHVRTGTLLFEAEAILRAPSGGEPKLTVISNASSKTSSDEISSRTQAGGLIELAGDFDTAVKLYHQKFSKSSVPPLP